MATSSASGTQDVSANDEAPVASFFPFVTNRTSPLIESILAECPDTCPQLWSSFDLDEYFQTLWNELFASQTDLADVV
jgi:hypothetical protein